MALLLTRSAHTSTGVSMSSSACSGAAAEDSTAHQDQQSEGSLGMVTQGAGAAAATAVGVTSTCSSDGDSPAMTVEGASAGEQQPPPQQQLEPALRAAKCNAAVEQAGWSHAVGKQACKWGSAADATVNGKRLHPQHHASAGLATTASSTYAPRGSPRAGGGVARAGGGCKRPLPTSSSSSSLEDAEAENLAPQEFLLRILRERGYETAPVPADKQTFFQPPTPKQMQDYDLALINAVKAGTCVRA